MKKPDPKSIRKTLQKDVRTSKFYAITKRDGERAIALNLMFSEGTQKAFMYSYISSFEFNPSTGIIIDTTENKISIEGRNLQIIYENLLRHKILWIKIFLNENEDNTPENECFVSNISVN